MYGVRCQPTVTGSLWLLPDRSVVSGNAGIVTLGQRLLKTGGTILFEGVYTCNQNGSEIHIGLYSNSIINNGETQEGFSIAMCY